MSKILLIKAWEFVLFIHLKNENVSVYCLDFFFFLLSSFICSFIGIFRTQLPVPNTSLLSSLLWKQTACKQPSHNANIIKSILYSLHSYFVSAQLLSRVISPMRRGEIAVMNEAKQIFHENFLHSVSEST